MSSEPRKSRKHWSRARYRALLRAQRPRAIRLRTRIAILAGAVAIGIVATLFAKAADVASDLFTRYARAWPSAPLLTTPILFMLLVWLTRRFAPLARGSGIPQVIAAQHDPEGATRSLVSPRTVLAKIVLTLGAVLGGASVGREGPTVQLAAAVMGVSLRLFRVPLRGAVLIARGRGGGRGRFQYAAGRAAFRDRGTRLRL